MKINIITPGTGSFFCGVCLRDNAMVAALQRRGHDANLVPLYLPISTDEKSVSADMPIFFGGINVYLQQRLKFFRHTPEWVDRLFDSRFLLKMAARRSGMTQGPELGELTLSMLQGENGLQTKEVNKLVHYLKTHEKPDVVFLSTALQVGLVRRLKKELNVPVGIYLQGEDVYLDTLYKPYDEKCWAELAERINEADAVIAPSEYFGDLMARRLNLAEGKLHVVPNGVQLDDYEVAEEPPTPPAIGYLARLMKGKGLHTLIDAFILLKQDPDFAEVKLKIGGVATDLDIPFITEQRLKVARARLESDVSIQTNITRTQKVNFLRDLTLFSVPATYGEAFGLFLIEAMAAGLPVVQPRHAAFPEIIEATGGGLLCEPDDPESLAEKWKELLRDPQRAKEIGRAGRQAALERFSADAMAHNTVELAKAMGAHNTQPHLELEAAAI